MYKVLRVLITIILAVLVLFPLFYTISASFFSPQDFTDTKAHLLPSEFSFRNYALALTHRYFPVYALNSLITALLTATLKCLTAILSAFAFTHLSFKGKKALLIMLLATLFIPPDAMLYENYVMTARLGLLDTYLGIVFPSIFSATAMLLTMGSYLSADKDIYEASEIDGAGDLRYISSILVPMTAPVSITIFLQSFIAAFNSYLWPLLVTTRPRMRTIQIGITMLGFAEEGEMGAQFASIAIITLPCLVLLFFCRKMIMKALSGGIK